MTQSKEEFEVLLDVIEDWAKEQRFITLYDLAKTFSIEFPLAERLIKELQNQNIIDKEPTGNRGYHVASFSLCMKIYLLDQNERMIAVWKEAFEDTKEVEIAQESFHQFMTDYDPEAIVSPGNSFGEMTGGYDLAISEFFGWGLQKRVQSKIRQEYFGEQPVGTALVIDNIDGKGKKLIHVPSMRLPQIINEPLTIYQCTRAALMAAIKEKVGSIVLPAFGGGCGQVPPKVIARQMKAALEQLIPWL